MFYTYILRLNNGKYYIGYSSDLRGRVETHVKGLVPATRKYLPCKLVYYSAFLEEILAIRFEKYLKTGSGFAFRNKHFI